MVELMVELSLRPMGAGSTPELRRIQYTPLRVRWRTLLAHTRRLHTMIHELQHMEDDT